MIRFFDFIQESALDGLWYWDLEKPEEEWMNPKLNDYTRDGPNRDAAQGFGLARYYKP
jgi:hypothetical protein